ncbi:MAG: DUF5020 family protein [Prevotella sp.]|nr:DUF5020 family protein [Prevotella sp.]
MKKLLIASLLSLAFLPLTAQDIQLHYDLGHSLYGDLDGRPNLTSTVEMFRTDRLGSTYFFTDIDYYTDGAAGAYWEISREFNVSADKHWAAHVEYNGGATSIEHTAVATRFQHALLLGPAWNWANRDFTATFSLQAMYKRYFKGMSRNGFDGFQLTAVWSKTLAHGLFTFSGFADLWRDKDVAGKLIFLSEPQLWCNVYTLKGTENLHFSVGTEVELSNNFVFNNAGRNNKFYAIPTLALKCSF